MSTTQFTYDTPGTFTTLIAGASSAPTLKNLADAASILGNAIDNTAGSPLALIELKFKGQSNFSATATIEIWFVTAADDSNYEDGDASTTPVRRPDITFGARVSTGQQRITEIVRLPNAIFKPLLKNRGGAAFTNTDNENILSYRPYSILATTT